ncbi:MAG TPA: MBL fold metallo-hydrolase [Candidatus Aminicenantes bacterium]|nr:MBL fold metallo-hydrolase [Candidatus Aminicenantes bacterium]
MPEKSVCFCAYPSAFIYNPADLSDEKNRAKHLFWGDTVVREGGPQNGWVRVSSRDVSGWMRESDVQSDPLLDIIFLDVGQGDSCLVVTPADEKIIVDAGKEDNLLRYLRWRYKNYETAEMRAMGGRIKALVISHPDDDHYGGLRGILDDPKFGSLIDFEAVYHNGLFPRAGSGLDSLGARTKVGTIGYLEEPSVTQADLDDFFAHAAGWQSLEYPSLVHRLRMKNPATTVRMIHHGAPGIANLTAVPGLSVTVLGPVLEPGGSRGRLRTFSGSVPMTKNGHSVVLRIHYGSVSILLGGDLNIPSEKFLLDFYKDKPGIFRSDVLKAYHHGSGDFAEEFIEAVCPYVSIISSGDNESYSHPRADTMGFLGKAGRGRRPLIFSTELARSSRDIVKNPFVLKKEFADLKATLHRTDVGARERDKAETRLAELENKLINRSVSVYGAVNLRTDGRNLLMCQKKEAPNRQREEWDIYLLEPDATTGGLRFIPRN